MVRRKLCVLAVGLSLGLFLLSLPAAARAEGLLSIRVQEFEVTDARRLAELRSIEREAAEAARSDAEALGRRFWRSGFRMAAERSAQEGGPSLSEAQLEEMLDDMGFERRPPESGAELTRRAERLRRGSEEKARRLFAVTRGLKPKVEQRCVVAVGDAVEASVEEGWRTVAHHYRLTWLGTEAARLAIWQEAGSGLDELAREQAVARRRPLMQPILRESSGVRSGENSQHTLAFMELRPDASGAPGCRVRYPADGGPPETKRLPRARGEAGGVPSQGSAVRGFRSITPR